MSLLAFFSTPNIITPMKKLIICIAMMLGGLLSSVYAQTNVTALEYYIDVDPGFGNGTALAVTAAPDIANQTAQVNVDALTPGLHTLGFRSQDNNGRWSLTQQVLFHKTSPIDTIFRIEYFLNTDPGFGNAATQTVTPAPNISFRNFGYNLGSRQPGINMMGIRSQTQSGVWSLTHFKTFYRPRDPSQIAGLEVFIDTDPGIGNASPVTVTPAAEIIDLTTQVNLTTLSEGLHNIGVRAVDTFARWSLTSNYLVYKLPLAPQITEAEYFLNTDPGFGQATAISFTPGNPIINLTESINLALLPEGLQHLGIRFRDNEGNWSLTNTYLLYRQPDPAQITEAEYFLDTDPGFGQGMSIPLTAGNDIVNLSSMINLATLSEGIHQIGIRTRDTENHWSLTQWHTIVRTEPTLGNMVSLEYFFDTDPGFGQGTKVSFPSPATAIVDYVFLPNTTNVPLGLRNFYVRTWNGEDWSLTSNINVTVNQVFPVEWLYVDAVSIRSEVEIRWATTQEQNMDIYEVERSSDGVGFSRLGQTDAHGDSRETQYYAFRDTRPLPGKAYYRIKQVDTDGTFSYSEVRTVVFGEKYRLKVFPNPVKNLLTLQGLSGDVGAASIQVFNGLGQQVQIPTQRLGAIQQLDFSRVAHGYYTVQVRWKDQREVVRILKL